MAEQQAVFITGATGYVGCHLAHAYLKKGHQVLVLARDGGGRTAAERMAEVLTQIDGPLDLSHLLVITGDVRDTAEELVAKVRAQTDKPLAEVWHSAATFKFTEGELDEIKAINIQGVRNILGFTLAVNGEAPPPRYQHVSTAYSTGRAFEVVPEQFHPLPDSAFRSLYEWSKHHGETQVVEFAQQHNLEATIYRPAIIVGSPSTQVISYSAYYQVCEALHRLGRRVAARVEGEIPDIRMIGIPGALVNFVPIDFVVEGMMKLAAAVQGHHGSAKVFNVVNETPPTLELVHRIVCLSLGMEWLKVVPEHAFNDNPMTSLERVLARSIAFQAPYMYEEIHFATDHLRAHVSAEQLPSPRIDQPFLEAINDVFFQSLK
jgi:nucleoside-diphosphate-sugar epimerase